MFDDTLMHHLTTCLPAHREASEDGEYEEAFWLCAEASRALADVRQLPVAAHLAAAVDEAYAEATVGLQLALQSVCTGFRAERYAKVCSIAWQSHMCTACAQNSSWFRLLFTAMSHSLALYCRQTGDGCTSEVEMSRRVILHLSFDGASAAWPSRVINPFWQATQVLAGYHCLGDSSELGAEVMTCFSNAVDTSAMKVRHVLLYGVGPAMLACCAAPEGSSARCHAR